MRTNVINITTLRQIYNYCILIKNLTVTELGLSLWGSEKRHLRQYKIIASLTFGLEIGNN